MLSIVSAAFLVEEPGEGEEDVRVEFGSRALLKLRPISAMLSILTNKGGKE